MGRSFHPAILAALVGYALIPVASAADRIQIVSSADGRLEVFVKCVPHDEIYHAWQTQVESGLAATHWHWETSDTGLSGDDFVAGRDSQNRVFVASVEGGVIRFNGQPSAGASLGGVTPLATHDLQGVHLATNADGRIEFFSLSGPGTAWSTAETAAGNRTFANHNLAGIALHALAPTPYKDGRLALVALGGDRGAWWEAQTQPNGDWGPWSTLGGHDLRAIAAAPNADGRLDIVALGGDHALYHVYELPQGGWSTWEALSRGPFAEPINLVRAADGRLELFLRDATNTVMHASQVGPNGGWSGITPFGFIPRDATTDSVTRMPDGRLVIAGVRFGDDYPQLWIAGQVQPNGSWDSWSAPPTRKPAPPAKPDIKTFSATPDNCYGPIGITCAFSWVVQNCGSDCRVSFVGKTGLGSYTTVFFSAPSVHAQGNVEVKPQDTNTLYVLSAANSAGSVSKSIEGKLMPAAVDPCAGGCSYYYFKMVSSSPALPCMKKAYMATSADSAEQWAKAEFPGYTVTRITQSQFVAVGC